MRKVISDRDFERELNNINNKLIMEKACSRFKKSINEDDLRDCKLIALWSAMKEWSPDGRKFTSFLYQRVHWECLKIVQNRKKSRYKNVEVEKISFKNENIDELIEFLPPELQDILIKRYVYRMTLREISEIYGCCHETVRRKIHKAQKILKNNTK